MDCSVTWKQTNKQKLEKKNHLDRKQQSKHLHWPTKQLQQTDIQPVPAGRIKDKDRIMMLQNNEQPAKPPQLLS